MLPGQPPLIALAIAGNVHCMTLLQLADVLLDLLPPACPTLCQYDTPAGSNATEPVRADPLHALLLLCLTCCDSTEGSLEATTLGCWTHAEEAGRFGH